MNTNPQLLKAFIAEQLEHGAVIDWDTDDVMPKDGPMVTKLTGAQPHGRAIIIVQHIEGGTVVGWEIYSRLSLSPCDNLALEAAHRYLLGWPT